MEIPGSASYSGQPTLTSPLDQQSRLSGQQTPALDDSETAATEAAQSQSSTELSAPFTAVEQSNAADSAAFDSNNPGGTIDLTV